MYKNHSTLLKYTVTMLFIGLDVLLPLSAWITSVNATPANEKCIAAAATWTWDDSWHVGARYALATRLADTCEEARKLAQKAVKRLAKTHHGATIAATDHARGKPAVCVAYYRFVGIYPKVRAQNGKDLGKLKFDTEVWGNGNHTLCATLADQADLSKVNQTVTG